MSNSNILEATDRLVAWRINDLETLVAGITSEKFTIGKWVWHLECKKHDDDIIKFKLVPKDISLFKRNLPTPIATVVVRMLYSLGSQKLVKVECIDTKISRKDGVCFGAYIGTIDENTPITLSWEFVDLKVANGNDGKFHSIWDEKYSKQNSSNKSTSRILSQLNNTDVVINTRDGSIESHQAILAANSPVFRTLFSKTYEGKETMTIKIEDMSIEACKAMLNFIYGKRRSNEIRTHAMELVIGAHIYDIVDLKKVCEACLCEDVGMKNVFQRLACASIFGLPDLKYTCLFYLVKMGTIYELQGEYSSFRREADLDILVDITNARFHAWKLTKRRRKKTGFLKLLYESTQPKNSLFKLFC